VRSGKLLPDEDPAGNTFGSSTSEGDGSIVVGERVTEPANQRACMFGGDFKKEGGLKKTCGKWPGFMHLRNGQKNGRGSGGKRGQGEGERTSIKETMGRGWSQSC